MTFNKMKKLAKDLQVGDRVRKYSLNGFAVVEITKIIVGNNGWIHFQFAGVSKGLANGKITADGYHETKPFEMEK